MHVIIIGAGISGLSVGAALVRAGVEVTVLEKDNTVGGFAASFTRNNCIFDLGPHIFFGKKINFELGKFFDVQNVIVEKQNLLKRGIYIQGKFFSYPLQMKEILKRIEKWKLPRVIFEIALANLKGDIGRQTVEGWVKGKIGKTLFDYIEMDTYVRKLYGISASETSSDWSKHRLKPLINLNLWKAINASLNPLAERKKRYTYYCPNGIGEIANHLADYVTGNGGRIVLDCCVERVRTRNGMVKELLIKEEGKEKGLSGDLIVSTVRISDLVRMLEPEADVEVLNAAGALKYRDLVLLYLVVKKRELFDRCLVYFSTRDTLFKRITEFKHFSPRMAPENLTGLSVEICVNPGDDIWRYEDKQIFELVIKEMEELDILKRHEVLEYFTVKLPSVYPVYFLNYQRHLRYLLDFLMGISDLVSIGRSGLYQHDNMPLAIESGLDVAELIKRYVLQNVGKINQIIYNERLDKYRAAT